MDTSDDSSSGSYFRNRSSDELISGGFLSHGEDETSEPETTDTDSTSGSWRYITGYEGILRSKAKKMIPLDETLGIFMASTPPVIESVLWNMTAKQLNQCAKVCKMWSHIANIIKSKRNAPFGMFRAGEIPTRNDFQRQLMEAGRNPHFFMDSPYVGDGIKTLLNSASSTPQFGLLFTPSALVSSPHRFFSNFSRRKLKEKAAQQFGYDSLGAQLISEYMPSDSSFVICTGTGALGTISTNQKPVEIEGHNCLSSVFFPESSFETSLFSIPEFHKSPKRRKTSQDSCGISGMPISKDAKCLLIFLRRFPKDRDQFVKSVFGEYLKNGEPTIAIGGVVCCELHYQNRLEKPYVKDYEYMRSKKVKEIGVGILISGSKLDAATMILEPEVNTELLVLERLRELKAGIKLRKRSVCLLFVCCARGMALFDKPDVETGCFYQIFPNVPIYGVFGNGEIGLKFLPKGLQTRPTNDQVEKEVQWRHGYTSIFTLLTWD